MVHLCNETVINTLFSSTAPSEFKIIVSNKIALLLDNAPSKMPCFQGF